eukprot:TRINITY_DN3316_c0_g1_i2.p1 TRINITY_DN3316_c0_g1~~TRINITY_DN3316_c0_g1_i2.p1  ORF type:complete len:121 (+),score=15.76 TRINITY_DN3316_c0_g1_i2:65-427(+)
MSKNVEYEKPIEYDMEPLYTLQVNLNSRTKQLNIWVDIVLGYFRCHRIYELSTDAFYDLQLFNNTKIRRRLNRDFITIIMEELLSLDYASWSNRDKSKLLVYWRTPKQWARIIYEYVYKA